MDAAACRTVDRAAQHLRRLLGVRDVQTVHPVAETVGLLLLWAYPDRVALRRDPAEGRYLLANGRGARLSERCAVRDATLVVAYAVERSERGDDLIRGASVLSPDLLRRENGERIAWRRSVAWDPREGRVVAREEERFGSLVLASRPAAASDDEMRQALLAGIAAGPGLAAFSWSPRVCQFRDRVRFLGRCFPGEGWPDLRDERLLATLDAWVGPHLGRIRSLSGVAALDLLPALQGLLTWDQLRRLDEGAPTHLTVPSGSRIALDYGTDGPPFLAVKLQELFGRADTPTVAWGRVPVVVQLLSPAGRPLQVTADLRGFWNGAYQEVKKEMKGRYPKHPWPEDPWTAVPTRKTKRHQGRD